MTIGKHCGIWGVELMLFDFDPLDMELGSWEIIAFKALVKLFGLNVVLAAVEISGYRATVSLLNCHLSIFWG